MRACALLVVFPGSALLVCSQVLASSSRPVHVCVFTFYRVRNLWCYLQPVDVNITEEDDDESGDDG